MSNNANPVVPQRLLNSLAAGNFVTSGEIKDLKNYLTFSQEALANYVPQSYAGNPENNVTANKSGLCVDTINDFMYYNFTEGATTGWTKIVT